MAYEINVSVFPPAGAGTAIGQGPGGQIVQQIIPAIEYKNVTDLDRSPTGVAFSLRAGDKIETNLPYMVRWIKQADEGN